ncbi:MAG: peptidoglycan DD-metalloendopeptidase family protein [Gammaproteobacteria bacterium]
MRKIPDQLRQKSENRYLAAFVACLFAGMLLFADACPAKDNSVTEKTRELQKLRSRIGTLQTSLANTQIKKSQAVEAVRSVEQQINKILITLSRVDKRMDTQQQALKKLQETRARQSSLVNQQRQRLVQEMQSAYAMGKQQPVKLLLNQEAATQLGRMLTYYGYLSKARANSIFTVRRQLAELQVTEADINDRLAALETLQQQELSGQTHLENQFQARKLVVSKWSKEMEAQDGQLSQLVADEKQLADLVNSLRQALADIPLQRQQGSFKSLKGKMAWPAQGLLKNSYGNKLPGTDIKSGGVLIKAAEGGRVRSVAPGRVAFADWIRGYGLLLILDHGEGYMSLYGHNQALYKEVGEWVDTGEVIAALGRSGGQAAAGLYFELRFKGQPVDPGVWCAGKPRAASG